MAKYKIVNMKVEVNPNLLSGSGENLSAQIYTYYDVSGNLHNAMKIYKKEEREKNNDEQEQDRVVNLNLEAGRHYTVRDIIELIQDPLRQPPMMLGNYGKF